MRVLATLILAIWLLGGLWLTLQPAHPLPRQVVADNLVPFHTLRIYLDNLGSAFWMRNLFGNLGLLFPLGLLGPIALPALDRWWRLALVALCYSATIELIQLFIPDRSADIDNVIVNVTGACSASRCFPSPFGGSSRAAPDRARLGVFLGRYFLSDPRVASLGADCSPRILAWRVIRSPCGRTGR